MMNEQLYKWRAMNLCEWIWQRKTRDQVIHAIDMCLCRSVNANSSWAKRYWHGVAEALDEKYIN